MQWLNKKKQENMQPTRPHKWMKVKEVAQYLDISESRVYALIRAGRFELKNTKFQRFILVSRADVEQYREEKDMVGVGA